MVTAGITVLLGAGAAWGQPSNPPAATESATPSPASPPAAAQPSSPSSPPAGAEPSKPASPPAAAEPSKPSASEATEPVADECARREAIDASITRVASARSAGQSLEELANEITAIEKRIVELPQAGSEACRPGLTITGLTERFDPIRQDLLTERRRRTVNAHPWPERIKTAVLENRLEIGMTREQVTAAWGQPRSVDVTPNTRQEQWTYGGPTYLYFTNGALVTIARIRRPLE